MIGVLGHLMLNGSSIFPLNEMIHIPSVLEELILRPEIFSKISISLKSDFAQNRSRLMLQLYHWHNCRTMVSSFPITIPFCRILFCRMAIASVSTAITKRYGDKGSPCRMPRSSGKKFEVKPLFMIQLFMSL